MQFGLFYEWPNPELRNWKTLYGEGVEEIPIWNYKSLGSLYSL